MLFHALWNGGILHVLQHWILTITVRGRGYYLYFTNVVTEA